MKMHRRSYESIDKLMKRLKKTLVQEGTFSELKERQYYEKPSDRRKREAKQRKKNQKKTETQHAGNTNSWLFEERK